MEFGAAARPYRCIEIAFQVLLSGVKRACQACTVSEGILIFSHASSDNCIQCRYTCPPKCRMLLVGRVGRRRRSRVRRRRRSGVGRRRRNGAELGGGGGVKLGGGVGAERDWEEEVEWGWSGVGGGVERS